MRLARFIWAAVAVACSNGGGAACINVPCPRPMGNIAIYVTSSVTGASLDSVHVVVNGDTLHAVTCNGSCSVYESAGSYTLTFTATGYQQTQRSAQVTSSTSHPKVYGPGGYEGTACGCEVLNGQQLAVALVPIG